MINEPMKGFVVFLIFLSMFAMPGCHNQSSLQAPELPKMPSEKGYVQQQAIYNYLTGLIEERQDILAVYASPFVARNGWQWWQRLSREQRQYFRENYDLITRVGDLETSSAFPIACWEGPCLHFSFVSCDFAEEGNGRCPEVTLVGQEARILWIETDLGFEGTTAYFLLFSIRLENVEVIAGQISQWERICWFVAPYPGVYEHGILPAYSEVSEQCWSP